MQFNAQNATSGVPFQLKKNLKTFVRNSLMNRGSAAEGKTALVMILATLNMTTPASGSSTNPTYQSLHQRLRD
ncbi:hypothetical protein PR202_ga04618 [Eleusine coracana subsp. coracana]|uniref:Uncharacterized protein n=1 Tax=Eleusine coracana subsp. coracana TaxID=191504 RepID=A0AAV5BQ38_ELECO|nr:hypothetical protein PR202_ga04618 [Eleusine coracana subsp. coracana]